MSFLELLAEADLAVADFNRAFRALPPMELKTEMQATDVDKPLLYLYQKLYLARGYALLDAGKANQFLSDAQKAIDLTYLRMGEFNAFKYKVFAWCFWYH